MVRNWQCRSERERVIGVHERRSLFRDRWVNASLPNKMNANVSVIGQNRCDWQIVPITNHEPYEVTFFSFNWVLYFFRDLKRFYFSSLISTILNNFNALFHRALFCDLWFDSWSVIFWWTRAWKWEQEFWKCERERERERGKSVIH